MRALPLALALAALVATGCGGDDGGDAERSGPARFEPALRQLPARDGAPLVAIDVVAAKEEVGLRPNAVLGGAEELGAGRARLLAAVSMALPYSCPAIPSPWAWTTSRRRAAPA